MVVVVVVVVVWGSGGWLASYTTMHSHAPRRG